MSSGRFRRIEMIDLRAYEIKPAGLGIERHPARIGRRWHVANDNEIVRVLFCDDRHITVAIGTESELADRIEGSCIATFADGKRSDELAAVCIHHDELFIGATREQPTRVPVQSDAVRALAVRYRVARRDCERLR